MKSQQLGVGMVEGAARLTAVCQAQNLKKKGRKKNPQNNSLQLTE
jgi:hypothetical protein